MDYVTYPEGSVLIEMGSTCVLCNVTVGERLPAWRQNTGAGWLTAEYALLPRATHKRTMRENRGLRGRTQEIRRLIGRSLRAAVDLAKLGPRQLTVDCDVLQADGGTRTASITGAYVAVALALRRLAQQGALPPDVLRHQVAAISVGMVNGKPLLDLCYVEDASADVDLNVVADETGSFIEIQGTAEGRSFDRASLDSLLDLAVGGIERLMDLQKAALDGHEDK
ncbi:MAG: ribonuclease PH [Delftia sp.]|nr:ribonuclease PH [Delftia sp.]